jgi:2-polyprenyl-3-methyl-5-hydroxy-6-metoxy-1,4-benzoquinol methylase
MERLDKCPVCAGNGISPYLTCEDFTVSHNLFNIVSCDNCGFKFTNPRPRELDAGKYYKSDDYVSHSNTNKGLINKLYKWVRNYTLSKKEQLIRSYNIPGRLLDYGAGTGMFLAHAKSKGWEVLGIEVDENARKISKDLNGITLYSDYNSLSLENSDIKFNSISLWHVLEHIYKIDDTLKWLYNCLDDGGTLFIAVPNFVSYDADLFKEYWAAYDVPRHIYHFSPDTIKAMLKKHSFRYIEQRPMKFDSFYVSLLSTKYKHGSTSFIRAFLTGFKSNLRASKDGNYSSLIYIFKKA